MSELLVGLIAGLSMAIVAMAVLAIVVLRPQLAEAHRRVEEAERQKQKLIDEGQARSAELIKEAKDEISQLREKAEQEQAKQTAAITRQEEKLYVREEALETRRAGLEKREDGLREQEKLLSEQTQTAEKRAAQIDGEYLRVSGLTADEAKAALLERIEDEFREIAGRKAKQIEADALVDADRNAKKLVLDAMQKSVVDYVTAATLAVVELPSEDMKGRIIGREGRNIRAFEQVTGVDLIIDETPEAVVISCFDPVRRETARLALMNLMVDGRIHPGRIEELYEKAQEEVERTIRDAGERAAERANVAGLPPKVVDLLGRLRFRTSYAQNVLDHSVEVSRLCANLAAELGLNVEVAKRAGLLHDIGKALGPEWEGPHALTGMEFLRGAGEKEPVLVAVGAHHHEIEPTTPESVLVIIADTISAARPGARRESLENYIKRLTALEELATSFPGVERSFAVQAGREIRLIVKPEEIDDLGAARLADAVARRIEAEMEYPGQIKVTVIRETRASDLAK